MPSYITGLDHIQIAAPMDARDAARTFYGDLLSLEEIEVPEILRDRACCWFQCGPLQIHIGTQQDFQPARKAHPAFMTNQLDELRNRLQSRGINIIEDSDHPDYRRFFAADPWGNRLEFLQRR